MAHIMPSSEITLAALHGVLAGRWDVSPARFNEIASLPLGRVVTDSREVRRGDIFWALRGKETSGAHFLADATSRGAWGTIADTEYAESPQHCWHLQVKDSLAALQQLASWNRTRSSARVVGVAGSVGKTTTRLMIDTVLAYKLSGCTTQQNYNNHVGLPLSLLPLAAKDDYAALELAASAPGEIAALAEICKPNVAVVTRIAQAHLAGFGDLATTAHTKLAILDHLPPSGNAILFGDCPQLRKYAADRIAGKNLQLTWVGRSLDCDLIATHVGFKNGKLKFTCDGTRYTVRVWGRHYVDSALAAIVVGREFGMSDADIAAALAGFDPPPQRCEVARLGEVQVIDDTYNANPTAMRAAFELLRDVDAKGRRIVVCGDMRELGPLGPRLHEQIGDEVVTRANADLLIACGSQAKHIAAGASRAGLHGPRLAVFEDPAESVTPILNMVRAGDVVLVKGSRVMGMERVSSALRNSVLQFKDARAAA
jgi:UDP-N-acetylmuramoyl-tripeptide--D-alanyl-D-alanine ligase